MKYLIGTLLSLASLWFAEPAFAEEEIPAVAAPTVEAANLTPIKPFRTFVTFSRYNLQSNGEKGNSVSSVRVEVTFPNGNKVELPEGGNFWPIGNGQSQEIGRTFEIPYQFIQHDRFAFRVQIHRKGKVINPCEIDVQNLSQFNRTVICRSDLAAQAKENRPADQMTNESIEMRVFSDRNSTPKEIPQNAIALR